MAWRRAYLVGLIGILSLGLNATVSAAQSADTVRGVVYDSLLRAPLEGATVVGLVPGSGETARSVSAITNAEGAFRLIAEHRITRVTVYHDDFERIGIHALETTRPSTAARWSPGLATPSLGTLWGRLCERPKPAKGRTGILYGTVRLSDDTTRVAGASVTLGWESVAFVDDRPSSARKSRSDSLPPDPTTAMTRSNGAGEFLFCGVPDDFGQAGIVAQGALFKSSEVLLFSDGRPVRRVDLVMADSSARSVVRGILVDDEGRPIVDGTVSIDGAESAAISGMNGEFQLIGVPMGTRMLWARKVGFLPAVVTADVMSTKQSVLRVSLQRGVTLEGVKVTARRTLNREAVEFNRRRLAGLGRYLDAKQLQYHTRLQDALRLFPSINVRTANNGIDFVVLGNRGAGSINPNGSMSGGCRATIFVDGIQEDPAFLSFLQIESLASIEVYSNGAFAPVRYKGFQDTCAVILVWSKAFLMR